MMETLKTHKEYFATVHHPIQKINIKHYLKTIIKNICVH